MFKDTEISVLMPVHNGMPYLPEAVESILSQSYQHFELLAIDDGSSDGTAQYLRSIQDPRVCYHRLCKVGLVQALNYGLKKAQGRLIARMDADDVALPQRLESQHVYFQNNPECVMLGCDYDEIDSHGRIIGENEYRMTTDTALRWQMLLGNPFHHPSIVFTRQAASHVGGYRDAYDTAEDYDMWVRLAECGPIASLPDRLMRRRSHPTSVTALHLQRSLTQSSQIAADYARKVSDDLDPSAASELYWFYQLGLEPEHCSMSQLVRNFNSMCELFPTEGPHASPDLTATVDLARQRLRRHCLHHLGRTWFLPQRASAWVKIMKSFDPERGTLKSTFLRYVRIKSGAINSLKKRHAKLVSCDES